MNMEDGYYWVYFYDRRPPIVSQLLSGSFYHFGGQRITDVIDLTNRTPVAIHRPSPLGYCPLCSAEGATRERRPEGNDTCDNGHTYPSASSLKHKP